MLWEILVLTSAMFLYIVMNNNILPDEQIRAFRVEYAQRHVMFFFRYLIRVYEEILTLPTIIQNFVYNFIEVSKEVWESYWFLLEIDIAE
ncbi:hypothetical protein JTB14_032909 [Gonioctena quinquepunctata]|nr:hypothetical protein JTB14_032909 [Gonioctena quinquepunctata]